MRVEIKFIKTMEVDGEDSVTEYSKNDVELVEDMLAFFERSFQIADYPYVEVVTARSKDQEWVSGW